MALRTVIITTESDLTQTWTDSSCLNMSWSFIEQNMEECYQDDGTYVASYETLEVPIGETFSMTYLCDHEGEKIKTYTLTSGEYGIKP